MNTPKPRYGRKTTCPCPLAKKKFSPQLDEHGQPNGSGKCWSPACKQRFIAAKATGVHSSRTTEPIELRHHVYQTVDGLPHMRVTIRKFADGKKSVFTERWDGSGWLKGVDGLDRIPYRLPELVERIALGCTVVVCEGEKDVDRAHDIGITATSNPFGAGKWQDSMSHYLTGARVVIVPDLDELGWEHARGVEQSLIGAGAASVGILDLRELMPEFGEKEDLSDYLDRGGDPEALRQAIEATCDTKDLLDPKPKHIPLPTLRWNALPDPLKELVQPVEDERLRIALLMAAITTIGSVLPQVTTRYHEVDYGPALFLFISGPAGSGKGTVMPASLLIYEVDREIRDASRMRMREYVKENEKWKSQKNKGDMLPPEIPPRMSLRAAADSTGSILIRALCNNPCVLVFDTEGDTLNTALRPETIDASSALRKAWHHERIDQERVTDALYVATDRPHLAIVLTGTPNQIQTLVKHVETGLTSRICFVELPDQKQFRHPFMVVENRVQDIAISLQRSIRDLWAFVRDNSKLTNFRVVLSEEQQRRHVRHFKDRFEDEIEAADEGTTLRSGIVAVRIITVLSVVRQWFTKGTLDQIIVPTDEDFDLALQLAEFLRLGTDSVIKRLTADGKSNAMPNGSRLVRQWYDNLPGVFTSKEALVVATKVGIGRSTVYNLLGKEAYFERAKQGLYRKRQPLRSRGP